MNKFVLILALAVMSCAQTLTECADDAEIASYLADWRAKRPATALAHGGSLNDALCTQQKLVAALSSSHGRPVGYKAGLTSLSAQQRFGVSEPVRGVLLAGMLLEDGATVDPAFGARPLFEADLLLVIADAAVNRATGIEDALAHVSAIRPFIELPDLALGTDQVLSAATLTAGNVGARWGIAGNEIPVDDPARMASALRDMTVRVFDAEGVLISTAAGSSVMGHPVNSLLWLIGQGIEFKPGDLVSVGSIGDLMPPSMAAGKATVVYAGLPGDPQVSVRFDKSSTDQAR